MASLSEEPLSPDTDTWRLICIKESLPTNWHDSRYVIVACLRSLDMLIDLKNEKTVACVKSLLVPVPVMSWYDFGL